MFYLGSVEQQIVGTGVSEFLSKDGSQFLRLVLVASSKSCPMSRYRKCLFEKSGEIL
jgi:hypothetical protein